VPLKATRKSEKVEASVVSIEWPSKDEAERWEIENLIRHCQQFPGATTFEIIRKGERPDWIVRDQTTGALVGIELTSVYLHDRSVPDIHWRDGMMNIPYELTEVAAYGRRWLLPSRRRLSSPAPAIVMTYP